MSDIPEWAFHKAVGLARDEGMPNDNDHIPNGPYTAPLVKSIGRRITYAELIA